VSRQGWVLAVLLVLGGCAELSRIAGPAGPPEHDPRPVPDAPVGARPRERTGPGHRAGGGVRVELGRDGRPRGRRRPGARRQPGSPRSPSGIRPGADALPGRARPGRRGDRLPAAGRARAAVRAPQPVADGRHHLREHRTMRRRGWPIGRAHPDRDAAGVAERLYEPFFTRAASCEVSRDCPHSPTIGG
jgi:hypothetical protein